MFADDHGCHALHAAGTASPSKYIELTGIPPIRAARNVA
jgi:hypothetical protein